MDRVFPEGYQVLLDSRPVRTPAKTILTVPHTKPHLAEAIALEWDLLTSTQQALKHHLIPITSLTARAEDIVQADGRGESKIREDISTTVMRYLDTDTLLCWVPEKDTDKPSVTHMASTDPDNSLRTKQIQLATEIIGYLTQYIWPGISIKPVLDTKSIVPEPQSETTLQVIRGWIHGLPAYELAALERVVLASKSFLIASRLVVDWSENFRALRPEGVVRFGVDQAAEASSLEVTHQTDMWGEVEDTHDVDKEDIRRQLGSAILLVTGESRY
jgi:ATP synthase F1 complex assembly factor 2